MQDGCTIRGAGQGLCSRSWMCLAGSIPAVVLTGSHILPCSGKSSTFPLLEAQSYLLSLDTPNETLTFLFAKPNGLSRATKHIGGDRVLHLWWLWLCFSAGAFGAGQPCRQAPLWLRLPDNGVSAGALSPSSVRRKPGLTGKLDLADAGAKWGHPAPCLPGALPAPSPPLEVPVLPTNMTASLCSGSRSDAFHGVGGEISPALPSGQETQTETPHPFGVLWMY